MKNLLNVTIEVVNVDIIKSKKTHKEYLKIQGLVPIQENRDVLFGDKEILEIFEEYEDSFDDICANAKNLVSVEFCGYYDKFQFKPVSLVKVNVKGK